MTIAKIIVDVPLMQTDQPYSYKVPEEFEGMLEVGMRVHVPFGKANRLIQGIVLGIEQELWLAEELRKSVFSYKISILKAMLPGFLNSSYDKILYPLEGLNQKDRDRLFGSQESLAFSSLDLEKQAEMMRLTRKGLLKLEYQRRLLERLGRNTLHFFYKESLEVGKRRCTCRLSKESWIWGKQRSF